MKNILRKVYAIYSGISVIVFISAILYLPLILEIYLSDGGNFFGVVWGDIPVIGTIRSYIRGIPEIRAVYLHIIVLSISILTAAVATYSLRLLFFLRYIFKRFWGLYTPPFNYDEGYESSYAPPLEKSERLG
jgi:hypothetical protein